MMRLLDKMLQRCRQLSRLLDGLLCVQFACFIRTTNNMQLRLPCRWSVSGLFGQFISQLIGQFIRQNALLPIAWQGLGTPAYSRLLAGDHHFSVIDHLANMDSDVCKSVVSSSL